MDRGEFSGDSDRVTPPRSSLNRTITLTPDEIECYQHQLQILQAATAAPAITDQILNQDLHSLLDYLPSSFVDLLFLDPPYNLTKSFNHKTFRARSSADYARWWEGWFPQLLRTLKPTASVYICGDWRSSGVIRRIAEQYLTIRNRISWERDKGRGALRNWKNCSEDLWFCTVSEDYHFNAEAVRLKRKVRAPYRAAGQPKDWEATQSGNYRLTYASNFWTDLTVPFWSMPENTDHPTQKPEKMLAKIILASSSPGAMVLDPFLGSGTTAVVARKLGRSFVGIEQDLTYCCLAQKRLAIAIDHPQIQGYEDGVFWERNAT
jgi:site-specific DNA-methyltransferase (adenine-specific)